jgi:hypothetical protein
VSRPVPERLFVAVHDTPLAIDRQALGGDRRTGDIAAQAFQPAPLMGLTNTGGMQGEAGDPGQQGMLGVSSIGGTLYRVRALRLACDPMAMRYWMDAGHCEIHDSEFVP